MHAALCRADGLGELLPLLLCGRRGDGEGRDEYGGCKRAEGDAAGGAAAAALHHQGKELGRMSRSEKGKWILNVTDDDNCSFHGPGHRK